MKYLKEQYVLSWRFFRKNLALRFLVALLAFLLLCTGSYLVLLRNGDAAMGVYQYFSDVVQQSGIVDETGRIGMLALFGNNLRATFVATLLGLVPFAFLPVVTLAMNGVIIGGVLAILKLQGGVSIWRTVALGLAPHGIFEISAIMLGCAAGLYLCACLCRAVLRRPDAPRLEELLPQLLRLYLTCIVPLLLAAAAVETYVTPLLMQLA